MKTGTAHLPLHYGAAPRWLFEKMTKLAREISLVLISEYGKEEYLTRLSNPNWFQAFGCVLGFDWHSSGLTTTTCGALKEGLKHDQDELGLFICGGKGKASRRTPYQIETISEQHSINAQPLVYASKISAKVDNSALQDGYQLYHHSFFFTNDGKWVVVQQGMSDQSRWARRYHWLSDKVDDFVNEPHKAIVSQDKQQTTKNKVLNLVASESKDNRQVTAKVSQNTPGKNITTLEKLQESNLPERHQVLLSDINPENLKKILLSTYEQQPENFEKLLGMKGVGPKTIRALSLISELIHGASVSTKDPARYSFAHGGKDGTPYPVDRKTYNQSIQFLNKAIKKAELGHYEKLRAFQRLHNSYV